MNFLQNILLHKFENVEILFETASYVHFLADGNKVRVCKLYTPIVFEVKNNQKGYWEELI